MANVLTEVTPKLLASGVMALRQFAITPRLVNRKYEREAGQQGSTIDVPIPSAVAVNAVTPAATPPATQDVAPTSVAVPLSEWYEAPFYLTDKELHEVMAGTIPLQASEAIKALINYVDQDVLGLYKYFYGWYGTAGTTPFGSGTTADATGIRTVLNKQVAPLDDRHVIMNPDAEGAALDVRAFQDASYSGSVQAILEGDLNRKIGFQWWMDQNVDVACVHTAGTPGGTPVTNGAASAGAATVAVDGLTATTGDYHEGDIITFAGHTQTYVVTATTTANGSGEVTLPIAPVLQAAVADGAAVTLKASHTANLAMHRDAIAFATRPLDAGIPGLGALVQSAVDPISGLALRLEVTREHKRTRFSYDMLWGKAVIRRELGARLAG